MISLASDDGSRRQLAVDFPVLQPPGLQIPLTAPRHLPFHCTIPFALFLLTYCVPNLKMPYPETTDAFAVTDIKNWSNFTRKEVSLRPEFPTNRLTDPLLAAPQEVRGARRRHRH